MHYPRNKQGTNTDADFWNQFGSVNPRMAVFMKVTPDLSTGLSAIGLTSNTRDMTLPGHAGITFKAAAGMMPSAAEWQMNEGMQMEIQGIYDSLLFNRQDVLFGLWENSRVEVFLASWENVNLGELVIFSGFLGEFKDYQSYFKAEARGLIAKLSTDVVDVTSRACRVTRFRNTQCGHTASTVTIGASTYQIVTTNARLYGAGSADTAYKFIIRKQSWTTQTPAQLVPPDGFYNNGIITATAGNCYGLSREISKSFINGNGDVALIMKRAWPVIPDSASRFTMTAGCNRTVEDCKKYGNIINFRGEPYVPGLTTLSRVPAADE